MKWTFTLVLLSALFLASCRKTDVLPINEGEWLSKERGIVVYFDSYCDYFIIETRNGYTVAENWSFRPFQGDVIYGDLSNWGVRTVYNRSRGTLMNVNIRDSWLSYYAALDALDFYCN